MVNLPSTLPINIVGVVSGTLAPHTSTDVFSLATVQDVVIVNSDPITVALLGTTLSGGVSDHGMLLGLSDDDHIQYLLTDGSRALQGALNLNSNDINAVASLVAHRGVFTDSLTISGSPVIIELPDILATEQDLATVSGELSQSIQDSIDLHASSSSVHHTRYRKEENNAIVGVDGITVVSGLETISIQGFQGQLISASGVLQDQINENSLLIGTTSGSLQNQISTLELNAVLKDGSVPITSIQQVAGLEVTGSNPFIAPRLTTVERNGLIPSQGWVIFNTTIDQLQIANANNTWLTISSTWETNVHIQEPVVGDIINLTTYASAPVSIVQAHAVTSSGSVNYTLKIDGVAVLGLDNVVADITTRTTPRNATEVSLLPSGGLFTLMIDSVISGTNLGLTVRGLKV